MLFGAGAINAAVVIDDTFGDGDFATNTDGIGTGFVQFENTQSGDGAISESVGQAQIQTTAVASYQITGMASKDDLGVGALDLLTVVWEVGSVVNTAMNSVQLSVQGGTGYNAPAFLTLQMNASDTLFVKAKKESGGEFEIANFAYSKADLFDGFTVTLTASVSGWQYDFTGLGSMSSISGGYGAGNSFADLMGSTSRVGANIQRTSFSGVATLNLDRITAKIFTLSQEPLRIMTYNIRSGINDLSLVKSVIEAENPDLVALQEVDKNTTRSGGTNQAEWLAQELGMEYRFGKTENYFGGEYGIALLSRFPINQTFIHDLPFAEGEELRLALEAWVDVPDIYGRTNTLSFVSTHLDHLSNITRVDQVEAIVDALAPRNHPVIVAGDLNATPLQDPMALLQSSGYEYLDTQELLTFPAIIPTKKIDYIMVRTEELPLASFPVRVVDEQAASDHRPVVARLFLGAPADWLAGYGLPQHDLQGFSDSDGDLMDDYSEWRAGTNPTNTLSFFGFDSVGTGPVPTGFQLRWNSITNRTYQVDISTNLLDSPAFIPLTNGIQGDAGTTDFIDTTATNKNQGFYRVSVE